MAELNVRKRGSKWEYRFEGAKIEGKRNQITKGGFKTKKECLDAGNAALTQYNCAGLHFEPSDISFADYLDYWFDNYVKLNCKYNTQLAYNQIIEGHLKPAFGIYKLKALTPIIIQEYVNQKFVSGLKKTTLTNIIAVLSGSLKYAVVPAKLIASSPAEYIRYPKIQTQKSDVNRTVISIEDFNRIIERFPQGNPFHYALMIGFYTGLRIGEVYGLTWDDINFKDKTLTVNRIVYKRNYGVDVRKVMQQKGKREEKSAWYFGSTKTVSSVRTIKIGETLIESLKKWKVMQTENQLLYGEYYILHHLKEEKDEKNQIIHRIIPVEKSVSSTLPVANLIMRKENGEFSSPDSFKYAARVIHYDLGIKFNFHSLRHTHATMMIEAGISPKSVQERLGHQNIETTLQTYVHDTESMEQNAVDVFEKIVSGQNTL